MKGSARLPDLGAPVRLGPFLQADAPAGPTPGRAPDALAPESPIPREAGVFTPFLGKQTEAQRGETCPSSRGQQRWDCGSPHRPSWRHLSGRAPPSRPPVSSGALNGVKAADGLGIFSCLSPAPAHNPRSSGNKAATELRFPTREGQRPRKGSEAQCCHVSHRAEGSTRKPAGLALPRSADRKAQTRPQLRSRQLFRCPEPGWQAAPGAPSRPSWSRMGGWLVGVPNSPPGKAAWVLTLAQQVHQGGRWVPAG